MILYDAETLLETIRNVGSIPNATSLGSDDEDLLRHVNEALRWKIAPIIIQTREEYLAQSVRVDISGGKTRFRIPNRAIGNRLRDVIYVDGSGNRQFFTNPIPREELAAFNGRSSGQPEGYFLEGNYLQLVPTGGSYSGSLELSFFMRPSALRPVEETRKVDSVDLVTGEITLDDSAPSGWTTEKLYDIHSPDSGAEVKYWDLTASAVNGGITFPTPPIDGSTFGTVPVAAGDYVCLANECALLQVPDDMIPALAQAVALRIAVADGDQEMAKLHSGLLQDETQEARKVLENRIEGRPWRVRGRGGIRGTSFGG